VLCGLLLTKTFSIATHVGWNALMTSVRPSIINFNLTAKLSLLLPALTIPLAIYSRAFSCFFITPYPVILSPGSIPKIIIGDLI